MDVETRIRRFEQQLAAFEKLHGDELRDFEQKLATYMRLQADELKLLREQLAELKQALAAQAARPMPSTEGVGGQTGEAGAVPHHMPGDEEVKS